jgi:DNA-binding LacI/PurR family transcriptional regulator
MTKTKAVAPIRISQRELARELGLSVATINRALCNHVGTNPETRARVIEAAARKGYRLEQRGNSASRRNAGMVNIGVLMLGSEGLPGNTGIVQNSILRGLAEESRRRNAALHFDYIPFEMKDRIHEADVQPAALQNRQWKGTILSGHFPASSVKIFAKANVCVRIADYMPDIEIDSVDHDDMESCELLIKHLWRLGHRRIGIVDIAGGPYPCTYTRYMGYVGALARRNVAADPRDAVNILGEEWKWDKVVSHVRNRIQAGVKAWICINDDIGYRLIWDLNASGIACPKDVSICGFDNFAPPPGLPKLTSIDGPFEDMGVAALARLLERLKNNSLSTLHLLLRCRIVEGESTATEFRP